MGKYDPSAGVETEDQPGSKGKVLRNLLHITSKRRMDKLEFELLVKAHNESLQSLDDAKRFTAADICSMHRQWLGTVYEWAGRYRTVELAKGGFRWPPSQFIASSMVAFESGLLHRHTPCPPDSIEATAQRLAEVHAELLLIHPFRDGNGRVARWLADLMAAQAGFPLPDYRLAGRANKNRQKDYIAAVQAGYLCRYERLATFFADALRRGLDEDFTA